MMNIDEDNHDKRNEMREITKKKMKIEKECLSDLLDNNAPKGSRGQHY